MIQLRKIGVMSCAKISALFYTAFAIVILPFLLLAGIAMSAAAPQGSHLPGGVLIIEAFVLPIFYAVFGFIGGALAAWIYNFIAAKFGGLEMQFSEVIATSVAPAPTVPTADPLASA